MVKVANLSADLTANTSTFDARIKKSRGILATSSRRMTRNAETFSKRTSRAFKVAGKAALAFTAAAAGMSLFLKRSLNVADSIAKTADKIGLTTDALQELRFAADLAGVAQKTFDMGMQRFVRRTAEAAQGTGEAKDALKQLKIELRDTNGNLKSGDVLLMDVADAMQNVTSEGEKVRLAFKLFDSEGVALINMLKNGSAAMQKLRNEAQRLGIVMGEDLIRSAEKAKDELDTLGKILSVRLTSAIIQVAPEIEALTRMFIEGLPTLVQWVSEFSKFLGLIEKSPEQRMALLSAQINLLNKAVADSKDDLIPDWLQAGDIERIKNKLIRLREEYNKAVDDFKKGADVSVVPADPEADKRFAQVTALSDATKKAEFDIKLLTSSLSEADIKAINLARSAGLISDNLDIPDFALESFRKMALSMRQLQGAMITRDNLTNAEKFAMVFKNLNVLLEMGAINQETFNRELLKVAPLWKQYGVAATDVLTQIDQLTAKTFKDMEDSLVDFVRTGKLDFRSLADSIISDIIRIQVRKNIVGPLAEQGGGFLSSFLGDILQFADGGRPPLNRASIVGEAGPELFVPDSAGTIIPNDQLGGGMGGGPTIFADMRGASVDAVARLEAFVAELNGSIEPRAINAVAEERQRSPALFGGAA